MCVFQGTIGPPARRPSWQLISIANNQHLAEPPGKTRVYAHMFMAATRASDTGFLPHHDLAYWRRMSAVGGTGRRGVLLTSVPRAPPTSWNPLNYAVSVAQRSALGFIVTVNRYRLVRSIKWIFKYFSSEKGRVTMRTGASKEKRQRHAASLQWQHNDGGNIHLLLF